MPHDFYEDPLFFPKLIGLGFIVLLLIGFLFQIGGFIVLIVAVAFFLQRFNEERQRIKEQNDRRPNQDPFTEF